MSNSVARIPDSVAGSPELTISFSFDPKSNLFRGRLPNGAFFNFSLTNVSGKLGSNLELFAQGVRRLEPGKEPLPALPTAAPYSVADITRVAPGRASGVNAAYDQDQRRKAKREARRQALDLLSSLELEPE
jgi:hypothetical protein